MTSKTSKSSNFSKKAVLQVKYKRLKPKSEMDPIHLIPPSDYQRKRDSINLKETDEEYKYMLSLTKHYKMSQTTSKPAEAVSNFKKEV